MRHLFTIACVGLAMLSLASVAQAEIVYADSWQPGTPTVNVTYGPGPAMPASAFATASGGQGVFEFNFPSHGAGTYPDFPYLLVGYGSVVDVGSIAVEFEDSMGNTSAAEIIESFPTGLSGTEQTYFFNPAVIPFDERQDIQTVRMLFNFSSQDGELGVSYIANPEPGSLALLGLGLCGIAFTAARRRRRKSVEN